MKALCMIPAAVAATAVVSAGVPLCTVGMLVVGTSDIRMIVQIACKECLYCLVTGTADAAIKLDSHIPQCHLRTAADAAADQGTYLQSCQKLCQSAMTEAVGVHDLCRKDVGSLYCVDLELLRMSEVLKDLSIFISNCNFHSKSSYISQLPSQFANSV